MPARSKAASTVITLKLTSISTSVKPTRFVTEDMKVSLIERNSRRHDYTIPLVFIHQAENAKAIATLTF